MVDLETWSRPVDRFSVPGDVMRVVAVSLTRVQDGIRLAAEHGDCPPPCRGLTNGLAHAAKYADLAAQCLTEVVRESPRPHDLVRAITKGPLQ